jgi:biopolymer transport protein ExbB/TolQ
MISEDKIRKLADNALLLLVSRAVAPMALVLFAGILSWVVMMDRSVSSNTLTSVSLDRRLEAVEAVLVERNSWGEMLARMDERSLASTLADAQQEAALNRVEDRLNALSWEPRQ